MDNTSLTDTDSEDDLENQRSPISVDDIFRAVQDSVKISTNVVINNSSRSFDIATETPQNIDDIIQSEHCYSISSEKHDLPIQNVPEILLNSEQEVTLDVSFNYCNNSQFINECSNNENQPILLYEETGMGNVTSGPHGTMSILENINVHTNAESSSIEINACEVESVEVTYNCVNSKFDTDGEVVLDTIEDGINDETIDSLRLGYIPSDNETTLITENNSNGIEISFIRKNKKEKKQICKAP